MRMVLQSVCRAGLAKAVWVLLWVLPGLAVAAEDAHPERGDVPVVVFDPALEAPLPDIRLDSRIVVRLASEGLGNGLRATGYTPSRFDPNSPSLLRAAGRGRALRQEDLEHPEHEASARKIGMLYGARYVLFPRLQEAVLDPAAPRARLSFAVRVVPDLGVEREVKGSGTAEVEVKGGRSRGSSAERLLVAAAEAAGREIGRQLSASAPGAPADSPRNAASYYAQAMQCLKDGRTELVIPLLERATQLDPRNVEYAKALGDAYERNRQSANALMEYRRAVTIQPMSVDLRVRIARIYLQRSMVSEARDELRRASHLDPENEGVRSALLEVYLRNGMFEEAIAEYRRALAARPGDIGLRLALGDLLVRQHQLDDAAAEYRQAVSLDSTRPEPHEKLAHIHRLRGQHREALEELIQAHRTPAGADDVQRYRTIAETLDQEAVAILDESATILKRYRKGELIREDAYTAAKRLCERADAMVSRIADLKVAATLSESHRRRVFAYSLLTQSLVGYQGFYESGRPEDETNATVLHTQAVKELQRAQTAMPTP